MQKLLILQNTVEKIRSETSRSLPALAINILLSVVMKSGLSRFDLVSKLDAPISEVNSCVELLTTNQSTALNCAGLLYADQKKTFFLTGKGYALVGDLESLAAFSVEERNENSRFATEFCKVV